MLENTECRWVCDLFSVSDLPTVPAIATDHESGKVFLMLLSLGPEILNVEVAVCMGLDGDNLETSHDSRLHPVHKDTGVFHKYTVLTAGLVPCALTGIKQMSR